MSTSNLGIGDRVYLVSNRYTPSEFNPTKGSQYECKGTMYKIISHNTKEPFNCLVEWDNGYTNSYIIERDLMQINDLYNNYKSIW